MTCTKYYRILRCILCFILIVIFISVAFTKPASGQDQLVNYGITCSKDGQYVPVFDKAGSKNKIALLNPGEICALDSSTLISKYYWYRVVFFDENGTARAGYLKESNFEQMTTALLAEQMSDPEKAGRIAQFIALAGDSSLFLGPVMQQAAAGTSNESRRHYVLNTNTRKFHYPDCKSAGQIKPKNRKDFTGTRTEVINMGYVPCKNCNP